MNYIQIYVDIDDVCRCPWILRFIDFFYSWLHSFIFPFVVVLAFFIFKNSLKFLPSKDKKRRCSQNKLWAVFSCWKIIELTRLWRDNNSLHSSWIDMVYLQMFVCMCNHHQILRTIYKLDSLLFEQNTLVYLLFLFFAFLSHFVPMLCVCGERKKNWCSTKTMTIYYHHDVYTQHMDHKQKQL